MNGRAVDRCRLGQRWYRPAMAAVVIRTSRFVMHLPGYRDVRWVAADAINFFRSAP